MATIIPVDLVDDNPFQTRLSYDDAYVAELAADIARNDLLQIPIGRLINAGGKVLGKNATTQPVIEGRRPLGTDDGWRVQLAFGHNRLRAFRHLALVDIPVDLRELDDEKMAELAWAENEQRRDLSPIEEARAIEKMIAAFGWTHEQVAEKLGLARPTVSNKLRLLKLPADVIALLSAGDISEAQARALVPVYDLNEKLQAELELARKDQYWPDRSGHFVRWAREGTPASQLSREATSLIETLERRIENRVNEQRAKEKARRLLEKEAKKRAAARAEGAPVQEEIKTMRQLGYENYASLSHPVEGCDTSCPCYGLCINYADQPEHVCLDPKRRQTLQTKVTKDANKERRARVKQLRADLPALLDAVDWTVGASHELQLAMTQWAMSGTASPSPEAVRLTAASMGLTAYSEALEKAKTSYGSTHDEKYLGKLSGAQLLRFVVEAHVHYELLQLAEYQHGKLPTHDLVVKLAKRRKGGKPAPGDPADVHPPGVLVDVDVEPWPTEVVRCRECGCTDDDCSGCIERTGEPCRWVEEDLCSACQKEPADVSAETSGPDTPDDELSPSAWVARQVNVLGRDPAEVLAGVATRQRMSEQALQSAKDRGAPITGPLRTQLDEIGTVKQLLENRIAAAEAEPA